MSAVRGRACRTPTASSTGRRLGRIVFADPAALRDLEAIVHPAVRPRVLAAIAAAEEAGARAVVIEAIKLVEGGLAAACDEVWLVRCEQAVQRERLLGRGTSDDDAAQRIAAQAGFEDRVRAGGDARARYVGRGRGDAALVGIAFEEAWPSTDGVSRATRSGSGGMLRATPRIELCAAPDFFRAFCPSRQRVCRCDDAAWRCPDPPISPTSAPTRSTGQTCFASRSPGRTIGRQPRISPRSVSPALGPSRPGSTGSGRSCRGCWSRRAASPPTDSGACDGGSRHRLVLLRETSMDESVQARWLDVRSRDGRPLAARTRRTRHDGRRGDDLRGSEPACSTRARAPFARPSAARAPSWRRADGCRRDRTGS